MSINISKATINMSSLWAIVVALSLAVVWAINNLAWASDIQRLEKKIDDSDERNSVRYFLTQKRQLGLMKIMTSEESDAQQIQKDIDNIDIKILCLRTKGCDLVDDV